MDYFNVREAALILLYVTSDWITPTHLLHRTRFEFNEHEWVVGMPEQGGCLGIVHEGHLRYTAQALADFLASRDVEYMRLKKSEIDVDGVTDRDPEAQWWRYEDELEPDELGHYQHQRVWWAAQVTDCVDRLRAGILTVEMLKQHALDEAGGSEMATHIWGVKTSN